MWKYIPMLSFQHPETVLLWKREVEGGRNPRDIKVAFAQEIVTRFHSSADAELALVDFELRSRGGIPDEVEEITLITDGPTLGIAQMLKQSGLMPSTGEANRMIEQGGVKLDGEKVNDKMLALSKGVTVVAQIGKRRFARITLK